MRVTVTVNDARLRAWARRNPEAARRAARRFLLQAGQLTVGDMRRVMRERFGRLGVRYPGRGPPTGATGASVSATQGTGFVDIGPNTPYAPFVDTGTRPHIIRPRRARMLRFPTPGGGPGFVLAREVHHPGFGGHFFIERTARRVEPKLHRLAARIIGEEVNRA
jgi:hypothetical protein